MTTKPTDRNYDVGYGKPPVASRFRPGQSGNPKGRPKVILSTSELVMRVAEEKIVAMMDGKPCKMSKRIALVRSLFASALKGNTRATDHALKLIERAEELRPRKPVKHVVTVEVVEPDLSRYDPSTMPPRRIDQSVKLVSAGSTPSKRHPLE